MSFMSFIISKAEKGDPYLYPPFTPNFFFYLLCMLSSKSDLGFRIFYKKILFLPVKKFSYGYGAVSYLGRSE